MVLSGFFRRVRCEKDQAKTVAADPYNDRDRSLFAAGRSFAEIKKCQKKDLHYHIIFYII